MNKPEEGVFTDRIADPALTEDADGETWTGNGAGVVLMIVCGVALVVLVFVMRWLGLL